MVISRCQCCLTTLSGPRVVTAAVKAAVRFSEVRLLGEDQGVVHLDPEVAHSALQLRVAEQKLAGPQVARALINKRDFRPTQAVGAVGRRIEPYPRDPVVEQSAVLTGVK